MVLPFRLKMEVGFEAQEGRTGVDSVSGVACYSHFIEGDVSTVKHAPAFWLQ
jgi:hypothetical protein